MAPGMPNVAASNLTPKGLDEALLELAGLPPVRVDEDENMNVVERDARTIDEILKDRARAQKAAKAARASTRAAVEEAATGNATVAGWSAASPGVADETTVENTSTADHLSTAAAEVAAPPKPPLLDVESATSTFAKGPSPKPASEDEASKDATSLEASENPDVESRSVRMGEKRLRSPDSSASESPRPAKKSSSRVANTAWAQVGADRSAS